MHPRLLACLLASIAAAAFAAGWCLAAGLGWIVAILAYSASGSVVLVALSVLAVLIEEREERIPAPGRAQATDRRPAPVASARQRLV